MKAENTTGVVWQPFALESYQLRATFSAQERLALSTPQRRGKYLLQKPVPAFLRPLYDIATQSGIKPEVARITILAVLAEAHRQDMPYLWTEDIWQGCINDEISEARYWQLLPFTCHRFLSPCIAADAGNLPIMLVQFLVGIFFSRNSAVSWTSWWHRGTPFGIRKCFSQQS
jgi:hypothetical protein